MILDISTPALLFPAISLLLLAYTNRFLTTGQLIRGLTKNSNKGKIEQVTRQIINLKNRIELIKWMQLFGAASLLLCTFSMFFLFFQYDYYGKVVFVLSLLAMCISLIITMIEISISSIALNIELEGIQNNCNKYKK